ncbi:transporter MCH2 like protein [Verticillium longisporum]|nr:transporter MCH2 like protein [Verticillium longisporum]
MSCEISSRNSSASSKGRSAPPGPFLIKSSVGFSASQGSLAAAILNLAQGIGRPLIGLASDRYGRINLCGISTLLAALSTLFLWTFTGQHFAGTIVYSLFGAFAGSLWPTVAPVGAEVVGIQLLPSVLSVFWLVLVFPATFAQPIALVIKQPGADGYLGVQLLTGFMYIISFISIWLLRVWKLRQLENADLLAEAQRTAEEDAGDVTRIPTHRTSRTSTGRMVLRGFLSLRHV